MTSFFEVIGASASHIYHSAVPLSPRASLLWRLYEPHVRPLVRVVHGIPTSWDSSAATFKCAHTILAMAWSPCSRFIAVATEPAGGIQILDAVTLDSLLTTSPIPHLGYYFDLIFSPGGHLLTLCFKSSNKRHIASWDLQTGGLTSNLEIDDEGKGYQSMTYSECGTMVGCLFTHDSSSVICTCNTLTSTNIATHSFKGKAIDIWVHGEFLQFATLEDADITIWEAGFTFVKPPAILQSLSIPHNIDPSCNVLFNPTLLNLACYSNDNHLIVWDTQNSILLLDSADSYWSAFSLDGQLFAYWAGSELSIQKHSPTGYTHLQSITNKGIFTPQFSPNGQFILMECSNDAFQLLSTEVPATPLSDLSTQTLHHETKDFILEFTAANTWAVVARDRGKVVTVLDLSSGLPLLTIDMDTEVYAARVVENTAFVLSDGKVFTWNIPLRGNVADCRADIKNSVSTTRLEPWGEHINPDRPILASISPDSHHVVVIADNLLDTWDMTTRNHLSNPLSYTSMTWFTSDGNEIHSFRSPDKIKRRKIIEDGEPCITKLESQLITEELLGLPWLSSHGYKVTDDGWILGPSEKQLLWLPHHWRLDEKKRRWGGCYLGLFHNGLPDAVVLDLQPEKSHDD